MLLKINNSLILFVVLDLVKGVLKGWCAGFYIPNVCLFILTFNFKLNIFFLFTKLLQCSYILSKLIKDLYFNFR